MPKIYIFNPQHDLAMAADSVNFTAPESAMLLASDLSLLPCWYADEGGVVVSDLAPDSLPDFIRERVRVVPAGGLSVAQEDSIEPWGWDLPLYGQLSRLGVDPAAMPSLGRIEAIRRLSHRRISVRAMDFIRENISDPALVPDSAVELSDMRMVADFARTHGTAVLKAPWSGSGKGVFWSGYPLTHSIAGWCERIIDKQGCVMGERALDKLQDFAMEFYCDGDGGASFAGYSLFVTERAGVYRGNRLMSNEGIENELSRWVPKERLAEVSRLWIDFLRREIASEYRGYVGVDMLIYEADGQRRIDPAVELNMRMTMGMAARMIYDRYVAPGVTGWMRIEHLPPGQLSLRDREMREKRPLETHDGRIIAGYCPLCPIGADTVYNIYVETD